MCVARKIRLHHDFLLLNQSVMGFLTFLDPGLVALTFQGTVLSSN